ncbi:unnamed protein product [Cylindrotheca closterium]|uniref:Uncharacterized protein n=1 Tax=Cylindrotheca closterium TaxID=2856 RepID=A0AAD2FP18_9STRA|nr:unnamed protein product [Cylindrotheca closterium]
MVKLFKSKVLSRQRGNKASGIDHLTGITTATNNKNKTTNGPGVLSEHTQSTQKNMTADVSTTDFTYIFDDPKLKNEYQLMTTAAKKASFGQCFFARHRKSGDIVMVMAIQNEFMHKFEADLNDASKLESMMAAVDPSLSGLREMIGMGRSTALIMDLDMSPTAMIKDPNEYIIIEDHTTVQQTTATSMTAMTTTTATTEADEPFDDFGSWLQYWVCGAPSHLLLCNAPIGPPALTVIPECPDENTDSSNMKIQNVPKHSNRSFGVNVTKEKRRAPEFDARSVGVMSRIVDVDDATTVATSRQLSQHSKIRSRKNSSKYYKNVAAEIASTDGSKTLPSIFSMDSHSIPPEEDWFSMLDQLLTPDLR